jgi:hypothetical protein
MQLLSLLLGIDRRSVLRAVKRLTAEGYFKSIRHGGNFHCNHYIPQWEKFRQIDAQWHRRRTMSLSPCALSPGAGDRHDTQTFPTPYSYETCSGACRESEMAHSAQRTPPAVNTIELKSEAVHQRNQTFHGKHVSSRNAAWDSAERRWVLELSRRYIRDCDLYERILEVIDQTLSSAATEAELKRPGSGIGFVLDELRRRGLQVDLTPISSSGSQSK